MTNLLTTLLDTIKRPMELLPCPLSRHSAHSLHLRLRNVFIVSISFSSCRRLSFLAHVAQIGPLITTIDAICCTSIAVCILDFLHHPGDGFAKGFDAWSAEVFRCFHPVDSRRRSVEVHANYSAYVGLTQHSGLVEDAFDFFEHSRDGFAESFNARSIEVLSRFVPVDRQRCGVEVDA